MTDIPTNDAPRANNTEAEGPLCPRCETPLDVQGGYRYCRPCGTGWHVDPRHKSRAADPRRQKPL